MQFRGYHAKLSVGYRPIMTDAHTYSPKTECLRHRSNDGRGIKSRTKHLPQIGPL